jgi:hypothetical protein
MWKCPKCGQRVEDSAVVCWNCGTSKSGYARQAALFIRVFSVFWYLLWAWFVLIGLFFLVRGILDKNIGILVVGFVSSGVAICVMFLGRWLFRRILQRGRLR